MTKKLEMDFTKGKIFSKFLLFVLPIIGVNLLQAFYTSADMMIVGLSKNTNAVGSIGTTGQFIGLFTNLYIGFSVGVNVVVARNIGAKNEEKVSRSVHSAIVIAIVCGLFCCVSAVIAARPVLTLMGVEGAVLDLAVRYIYFYMIGTPFTALYLYLVAISRAKGDSRTPLIIGLFSGLLNVVLNLFFVLGLNLDVEGVALATAISNVVSSLILLIKQMRVSDLTKIYIKKIKLYKDSVKEIIFVGIPSAIQNIIGSLSIVIIQTGVLTVNSMHLYPDTDYQPVMAGVGVALNLIRFTENALSAVYVGAMAVASQNMGAKNYKRIYSVIGAGVITVLLFGLPLGIGMVLFHEPLFALYGLGKGVSIALKDLAFNSALTVLIVEGALFFICGFMDLGTGILRALGKSTTAMAITLIGAVLFRILWILFIFPLHPTLVMAYICYPITWVLTTITSATICLVTLSKKIKNQKSENESKNILDEVA